MELLSLFGIVVGILVFIFLAFKSFNLQLTALFASLVMLIFAGTGLQGIYDGIFTTWIGGVAGALKAYFLIFCSGAVFGKLMADGGATKSIAFAIADAVRKIKNPALRKVFAAFFVPLMYIILSYAGISGFVIVFTVLGIGYELFREMDVPWRLYCMGGASCASTIMVGGAIQVANVAAGKITGTNDLTSGMGISLVGFVFYIAVLLLMLSRELKRAEKNEEGFMVTGAEFAKTGASSGSRENLPNLILSIIPMVVVVLLCAMFKINTALALIIGCLLSIVFYWKNLNRGASFKKSIQDGMAGSFVPLMSVCCTVAMGSVIKTLSGFTYLSTTMNNLPPLAAGTSLAAIFSFVMASSTSSIPAFGDIINQKYIEAGLTPAMSHRLMLMSSAPFGIMFHNAGVVNASTLAKIEYKKAVSVYCRYSCLPSLPGLIIALALVAAGILH